MFKDTVDYAASSSEGLNPAFDFGLLNPSTIIDHVEELTADEEVSNHNDILLKLLGQIVPLDFMSLAFPQIEQIRERIDELNKKLFNPDGSINNDKSLDIERQQWKDAKRELAQCKLNRKHYLVLSVEHIISIAKENNWGLCVNHNFIYVYNGAFWAEIEKERFENFLGEAAEKLGVPVYDAKHFPFRADLFKQFLTLAYLPIPIPQADRVAVNLQNGTFEIGAERRALRPFDPSDFITYQLPFNYDRSAKAPQFQEYLNRVLPDKEKQAVVAEYIGYLFLPAHILKLEKALMLYGSGANGKSVFFHIVEALLGSENVSNYSIQSLTDNTGYFRAKIANKLVNYASELNSGHLETSIFKQLVSGEPVEARLPYGQPFTLTRYGKIIFNCNELPREVEHTNAYFRRFMIVEFDQTIPEEEQDKQLAPRIIKDELSGIFNWVLEGLERLLANKGFSNCTAVTNARSEYEKQSDTVAAFLDENGYVPSSESYVPLKDLYTDFRCFCIEDGFKPLNKANFNKRLSHNKVLVERKGSGNMVYVERRGRYE